MIHNTSIEKRCSCLTLMLIMLNKIPFRLRQGILLCPENCSYQQENRWESAKQRYILKSIYIPFPFYKKRKKFSGQFKICTRQAIIGLGSDTNIDNVGLIQILITFWLLFLSWILRYNSGPRSIHFFPMQRWRVLHKSCDCQIDTRSKPLICNAGFVHAVQCSGQKHHSTQKSKQDHKTSLAPFTFQQPFPPPTFLRLLHLPSSTPN